MAAPAIYTAEPGTAAHDAGPVDSPATPSSPDALARYEFESGKGKEGTKILMVEWSTASEPLAGAMGLAPSPDDQGRWEVSWPGKATEVFAQSERDGVATQRVYFLLPTEAPIPTLVTIAQLPAGRTLHAKPLPAIYAPRLGVDTTLDAGKRGVLHTIWAKKRFAQLEEEILREMTNNCEGVALVMAVEERAWIADHFGLANIMGGSPAAATAAAATAGDAPPTPQSPRSPVGGRLGEKLRGLKLATSPSDLAQSNGRHQPSQQQHHLYSLSPDVSDIAVPSKSAFAAGVANSRPSGPAMGSLDAIVDGPKPSLGALEHNETEEDLFAMPLSPRSPEMPKSPFSLL